MLHETIWFKPKKFWKYFAAYYPVVWQGWVVLVVAFASLVKIFIAIDAQSHSGSDTLIQFALPATVILALVDILTLHFGEYPSWWKHRGR